jgi:hypothetical protein
MHDKNLFLAEPKKKKEKVLVCFFLFQFELLTGGLACTQGGPFSIYWKFYLFYFLIKFIFFIFNINILKLS